MPHQLCLIQLHHFGHPNICWVQLKRYCTKLLGGYGRARYCLLPLLDGAHSHEALAEHLASEARAERLRFIKDDKPITDADALREFTLKQVELALGDLRRKALLVA